MGPQSVNDLTVVDPVTENESWLHTPFVGGINENDLKSSLS